MKRILSVLCAFVLFVPFLVEHTSFTAKAYSDMAQNVLNDTTLGLSAEKKRTMATIIDTMLNNGYEPAFIAGVCGNIAKEGSFGIFEGTTSTGHTDYMQYMVKYYQYYTKYSLKRIYNCNLTDVVNMDNELYAMNYKNSETGRCGFGIGCCQWTFARAHGLIQQYKAVAGNSSTITYEQTMLAESQYIVTELNGSYRTAYTKWKSNNSSNLASAAAAESAGQLFCTVYEKPTDYNTKQYERGTMAANIYTVMVASDPITYANISASTYFVKNLSTSKYLSVDGAKAADGQNVSVAAKSNTNAFKFAVSGGTDNYLCSMLNKSFVLNPYANNPASGTNVTLYTKNTDGTQVWGFEAVSGGYVLRLKQYNSNLVLAVSGTNVQVQAYSSGNKAQIWTIEPDIDTLSSISVTTKPTKTSYYLGEALNTNGMKITANYTNGKTKDVTASVKTSYDFSKVGTATVTVSYAENSITKTATFDVSVIEAPVLFAGSGTEADPYLIQSKEDLETFRDTVNNTSLNPTYGHAYYLQTVDIDLGNEEWLPIGVGYDSADYLDNYNCTTRMFFGCYDGGEHYIKGLKVTQKYKYSGLFSFVRDNDSPAIVRNLVVYGEVSDPEGYAGGIIGALQYGAAIENCGFVGDVSCASEQFAGGIAAEVWAGGTISNCYHNGNVTSGRAAGGIVGTIGFGEYNSDGDASLVQNCYHVNGTINGTQASGAIAAHCKYYTGISNTITIRNCYASTDSGANATVDGATVNTAMLLRASEMKTVADDLGVAFANHSNSKLNNGYPVFTWELRVKGDVNEDGKFDVNDAVLLQKWLLGIPNTQLANWQAADFSEDEKLDAIDLSLMKRELLHKG